MLFRQVLLRVDWRDRFLEEVLGYESVELSVGLEFTEG